MHLAGKGRAILADEMGLGKTVQGIAAALLMKGTVGIKRALVVGRGVDKKKVNLMPPSIPWQWKIWCEFVRNSGFRPKRR